MHGNSSRRKLSLAFAAFVCGAGALTTAQAAAPGQKPSTPQSSSQVIRRSIDLVTTDVIVRDDKGTFIPDLNKSDFEVYEEGVRQEIVSFVLTHGGRVMNADTAAPPVAPQEGILLPPARPTSDASGRI